MNCMRIREFTAMFSCAGQAGNSNGKLLSATVREGTAPDLII